MQRYPIRAALFRRPNRTAGWDLCSFATETHPNPSNFTNRSKQQMSEIGRKGGRKGGKAKGVGGFHEMDPEKQVLLTPPEHIVQYTLTRAPFSMLLHREVATLPARLVNGRAVLEDPRASVRWKGLPRRQPQGSMNRRLLEDGFDAVVVSSNRNWTGDNDK